MSRFLAVSLFVASLIGSCADKFVSTSMETLAAAQGAIVQAQSTHQAQCVANPQVQVCQIITRAVASQNTAVSALEAYCQLPVAPDPATIQSKGTMPCTPVPTAKQAFVDALANLSKIISEYQQYSAGGKTS